MRPEFVHSISKLHMIDAGIAFRCVQVKYAQDVASSKISSGFLGLCEDVQHENDQELPSEGTAKIMIVYVSST